VELMALTCGAAGARAEDTSRLPPSAPMRVDFARDVEPLAEQRHSWVDLGRDHHPNCFSTWLAGGGREFQLTDVGGLVVQKMLEA
jgi:hypothetical protein